MANLSINTDALRQLAASRRSAASRRLSSRYQAVEFGAPIGDSLGCRFRRLAAVAPLAVFRSVGYRCSGGAGSSLQRSLAVHGHFSGGEALPLGRSGALSPWRRGRVVAPHAGVLAVPQRWCVPSISGESLGSFTPGRLPPSGPSVESPDNMSVNTDALRRPAASPLPAASRRLPSR